MKYLTIIILLTLSSLAHAATAYWTGNHESVWTVTRQRATKCEYRYLGDTFWVLVSEMFCPYTIEVE